MLNVQWIHMNTMSEKGRYLGAIFGAHLELRLTVPKQATSCSRLALSTSQTAHYPSAPDGLASAGDETGALYTIDGEYE